MSISSLKDAKSTADTDNVVLRALLLQSIQCDDFAEIKLEITKDLDMKPIDIIESLKSHQLALDSGEQYGSSSRTNNDFTTSRCSCHDVVADCKEKIGETKPHFRITRWPKSFYEVCPPSLWK